jgi:membrane-bound ClpP family serine protease
LGQTAEWLEVLLFLAGIVCLLIEVFILPGFGIFGFGGGLLVFVSLVLACQRTFLPQNAYQLGQLQTSLLVVAGAGLGLIAMIYLLNRWLPRAPLLNRVMLTPPSGGEKEYISRHEALADFEDMVGQRGVTTTRLNPAGKARFGDKLLDVIADGERIDAGADVVITEVHGSRVLVEIMEKNSGI